MWRHGYCNRYELSNLSLNSAQSSLEKTWIHLFFSPVGWASRIHQLDLFKGVRPHSPQQQPVFLDMTLNNLMVRVLVIQDFG